MEKTIDDDDHYYDGVPEEYLHLSLEEIEARIKEEEKKYADYNAKIGD